MPCCSAWGCSNNSNTFKLYGFHFDRIGISKLCDVGGDKTLRSCTVGPTASTN